MTATLLSVRYRLSGDVVAFRRDMEGAAATVSAVPGLAWKIWGLDPERGTGLSTYLFKSREAADAFAHGPLMAALRDRADIAGADVDLSPIEAGLSLATGAQAALAGLLRPVAPPAAV